MNITDSETAKTHLVNEFKKINVFCTTDISDNCIYTATNKDGDILCSEYEYIDFIEFCKKNNLMLAREYNNFTRDDYV